MSGSQGYLYQNKLPNAVIAAVVSPSAKAPLIYPLVKKGTGSIKLTGAYTGAADKRIEVKVSDTALTLPVVSQPVFRGAGTGKIKNITVSGLDAQKISVLCLSTGTNTTKATIEIEGIIFQAIEEGAGGNDIYIVIDDSTLAFTASNFSTVKPLKRGDTEIDGQEWDFQTAVIQGDIVPLTAKRIAFGQDKLNIYLQYKKFKEGKWRYYFIPEIRNDVAEGSKVYFVTGGRKIYVVKGAVTEEYTGIVTIADFWQQVRDNSALIESPMTIDTARASTSPACREFATKTDAYFLSPYRKDGSSEFAGALDSIWVTNDAKTELIKAECMDNALIGAEIWRVEGSSSGDLGLTKTGIASHFGFCGFTIPQKFPKNYGTEKENWSHTVKYVPRSAPATPPPVCFSMRLGVNATPQTLILEYKKKPADCYCPSVKFSEKCLGLQEEGGEIGMPYTVPDLLFWTDGLKDRMIEAYGKESQENEFRLQINSYFDNFKKLAQRILPLPEESLNTWTQAKAYVLGDTIRGFASDDKWYVFECTTAGTSGTTEPAWTATIGGTVNDGSAVWKNIKYYPALEKIVTDYKDLAVSMTLVLYLNLDLPVYSWQANYNYAGSGFLIKETASDQKTYVFRVMFPGISGSSEPTWPITLGATVTDNNDVIWENMGEYKEEYTKQWDSGNNTWNMTTPYNGTWANEDLTYDLVLYQTLIDDVLEYERTYGLKKNSIISGTCYTDDDDDEYYWDVRGDKAYLPAYTDIPYYSTVERQLSDGSKRYENTREFALHISVPCGGTLLVGDQIEVKITGTAYNKTYQVGDTTYLPTVAKQNLHFHGGITGDDIYVFEVKGNSSFPNYSLDRKNPQSYVNANLGFLITDGIVPFSVGDVFEFNVEGGRFVWKQDGGSWSSPINISKDYQALQDGLEIAFDFGVSPSFVIDDKWEILCLQENRVANILLPNKNRWKGTGNLTFTFPADTEIDSIIIDKHNLTAARLQASALADFSVLLHDEPLDISPLICQLYEEPIEARYFRLNITGSEIGYVYLGNVMRLSLDADSIKPISRYQLARTEAKEPFALYSHTRRGYNVNYQSFIFNDDYLMLADMIDHVKKNNDMPIYFIPNVLYPETCMKALIETDLIEPGSDIDMNAPPDKRLYSLALQITGAE